MKHGDTSFRLVELNLSQIAPFAEVTLACLLSLFSHLATANPAAGQTPAELQLFEKSIRPVLVEHCYSCHSVEAEKLQGGLRLDSRAGIRQGGDSGPAVTPGKAAESLLLDALRYESFEMPPAGKLPDEVIADFERWIHSGAADPRDGEVNQPNEAIDLEQARNFWAFQPLQNMPAPEVENVDWPRTELDRYLLAKLEANGLQPAPDTDRHSLLRRIYFALIGLPPTPLELDAFCEDPSPLEDALATVVDRLLASNQFGERWGRHWLDVVRYADSSGGGRSAIFQHAWRYRDYVIDAFNADLPYDQFLREQLAGDLLEAADWQERRRLITATAFLALGPTNFELQDKEILEMDIVDEQLDTLGKALLGMTLGCARCHDHKFDPIPTRDYYAMAGILKSTKTVRHDNVSLVHMAELPLAPDEALSLLVHNAHVAGLEKERDQLKIAQQAAKKNQTKLREGLAAKRTAIEKEIEALKARAPRRPVAMAVAEKEKIGDIPIAIRGATHNRGPIVPRGILQVCSTAPAPRFSDTESGRRELAQWITDPNHPLTARVYVNRIWHWLFGAGLVRTVDNFGATGDKPSHPELLDYLATRFLREGWSTKSLIREIILSRAYGMSTDASKAMLEVDPDNRLLGRMNRQRLDAESIRDAMLFVSGQLEDGSGGPTIAPATTSEIGYDFGSNKRSVYLPVFRNQLPQIFEMFDFADPNIQAGWRPSSTTVAQAHYLMHHPFIIETSHSAASFLLKQSVMAPDEKLQWAFLQVLGRPPHDEEAKIARQFLEDSDDARQWAMFYQTLFQSVDFRHLN